MKLLPSPSVSSSSSTTITTIPFDANMCTPKTSTASCLSGILRRLLCSRSLPTYPSDQITDDSTSMPCDIKQQGFATSFEATATNPGIVARLMGLQSLPDYATSVPRTRSLNSAEFPDEIDQMKGHHRRVKSLSFHEMPTILELENEQFFVLSFEKRGDDKKTRSKEKKSEVGFGECRERRREKSKNKENGNENVLFKNEDEEIINKMVLRVLNEKQLTERIPEVLPDQEIGKFSKIEDSAKSTPPLKDLRGARKAASALHESKKTGRISCDKDLPDGAKFTRRKKMRNRRRLKNEEQEECSSEDSSPVSVLDFDQFIVDPEAPTSEEHTASRRKLSSRLDDHNQLLPRNNNLSSGDDLNSKRTEETCHGLSNADCHTQIDFNMWGEICQLAEAQVIDSIWTQQRAWKFQDFEDISADFGLQILNELFDELVDQLASLQEE
ncbi:uncharacterized protein LOC8286465 [Ricinus communis]|uniref:DUF3741 domain-containing protein n=1 Tax=Ricinus communis TaxID=3988 RepID=B9SI37_RICCO|nr:uncharacterized protein LOC8286465 [Ricinus communis]EEF36774.1 conserved hypothetical protein [Ricinus communis]|eukprot:XP_002525656.1 uncharacterized protein LOC8286465 [Ricinus communis]